MAEFRRGHHHNKGKGIRLTTILIGGIIALACIFMAKKVIVSTASESDAIAPTVTEGSFYPVAHGELVHHQYYTLSYLEQYEQAEWVAYELTREQLRIPNVARTDWFYPDSLVSTGSAVYHDYTGSSFTRGHLAPAGDMAFNITAMEESFFMSNISPQVRAFNGGVWRELEEQVRDWAFRSVRILVVTGPVLTEPFLGTIGKNDVAVPSAFYKVLYAPAANEGIAFVIPNSMSEEPLMTYAMPIDSAERITGIDFFPALHPDEAEETVSPDYWKVDEKRFQLRVRDWNFR